MSQVGGTVVRRNVGSVKAFWRLIFGVTGERDNRKGSHLHVPPSVTQANTPSRQVSMSFLPHTPFAASFYLKAFSLQDFLHPHLFSASSNSSLKLSISIPSHPQHPIFHHPHMLFFLLSTLSNTPFLQKCLLFSISSLLNL